MPRCRRTLTHGLIFDYQIPMKQKSTKVESKVKFSKRGTRLDAQQMLACEVAMPRFSLYGRAVKESGSSDSLFILPARVVSTVESSDLW